MSKCGLNDVIVGGPVVFSPSVLGEILKESCFYMSYDQSNQSAELFHNNGSGGQTIMTIRNVSYESVKKLAGGIGLSSSDNDAFCCSWARCVPIVRLHHDGSEDAEKIRLEACRLNMECQVVEISRGPWYLNNGMYRYEPDYWSADKVIKEMQEWAKRWKLKSYLKENPTTADTPA